MEEFESGRTPAASKTEADRLIGEFRSEAGRHRAEVLQEATQAKADIAEKMEQEIAALRTLVARQTKAIRRQFTSAKKAMDGTANQQKEGAKTHFTQVWDRVQRESLTRINGADLLVLQRRSLLMTFAQTEGQRPKGFSREEGRRAGRELETAAVECERTGVMVAARYPGSESPRPKQREAVTDVARESAADIRGKKTGIARDLESRTDGVADRYIEYARTVDRQLAEAAFLLAPSLRTAASDTQRELSNVLDGTLRAIDERLSVEKKILARSERAALDQLRQASSAAEAELRRGGRQAAQEIDVAAGALVAEIDRGVEEAATVVGQEEAPFIPGVREILRTSLGSVESTATRGRGQLRSAVDSGSRLLASIVASLTSTTDQLVDAATKTAEGAKGRFRSAATRAVRGWKEQAGVMATALTTTQNQQIASVLAEIDRTTDKARGEMIRMTGDFTGEVRRAADQSIGEAKKPQEGLEERAQKAAEDMDQPWYVGLGRALVQIAIGLVILVAVALVVAAIAAVFGVILTAWAAVMIAGAILLTIGLIVALVQRARQPELQGRPGMVILMALSDTVGVTGIIEGIRGRELFTDRPLSDAAATERGVLGVVTLVSLFLGARAAIKGPPGGVYTRPSTLRPGWAGFREFLPRGWQGVRSVGVEMWQGMQAGYRSFREWLRAKGGQGPSPEMAERAGQPSGSQMNRPRERPYHHPPGRQVISRQNPLRLEELDPNQKYLWVVDENGNWVFAPEGSLFDPATGQYVHDPSIQPGFGINELVPEGRVVKHGDLVPGPGGQSRGVARQGGELFAERDANGNLTGRWIIDNNSSYTFARTDETKLGSRELEGAFELLRQTGTDTNRIILRNTGNPEYGPAVTPSEGPVLPRPVTTGQSEEER